MTQVPRNSSGLALLFLDGKRPSVQQITRLLAQLPPSERCFGISFQPTEAEGWAELISNGLTFDITGLAPAAPATPDEIAYRCGFPPGAPAPAVEAVELRVGAHLSGGEMLLPVVRTQVAVAAALCALEGAYAVVWRGARSAMAPAYFAQVIRRWVSGGPFPALGLTALYTDPEGGLHSEGLAAFTNQELFIEHSSLGNPASAAKFAIRLIHTMVDSGPIRQRCEMAGPEGERLVVEPSADGRQLRVWPNS